MTQMKLNNLFLALCLTPIGFNAVAENKIKPIEPIMVTIPAGSFEMGSLDRESTQPVHQVDLTEFSLGKYEVTVKEFSRFIAATNYEAPTECRHELDGWFKPASKGNWQTNALNTSEYQPVVCINWNAAKAYVDWLTKETGKPYRLASEAEWEYAARAGTYTKYYFGDDPNKTEVCQFENTADYYGESILQTQTNTSYVNWSTGINHCSDGAARASIVGMYKPNPFGLHDMLSNVLEFVADCYVENYNNASKTGAPSESENCERRSTRGASWHWDHWPLTNRGRIPVDFAGGVDGFRIALDGKAPKLSKTTKLFQKELVHAQQNEQARRDLIAALPNKVENVTLKQQGDIVFLSWDKSDDNDVTGYRVYKNDVKDAMFKLVATNIKTPFYRHISDAQHSVEYTVVAVKKHLQGPYSDPIATETGWNRIPGQIEAEWAKSIKGASVTLTSDESRGHNLTGRNGIESDATMVYQIEVTKAGDYTLHYRVATPNETKGFELYLGDKKLTTASVKKTGGYHDWQTQSKDKVNLPKGKHTLTLKSLDSHWKLNWLALKESQ